MARCLICVRAIGCGCRTVCWLPAQADSLATFKLVPCPLPAANITTAAIFRSIEKFRPTLLLDEVETFIRENEGMRGALNSGFTRDSAVVIRTEGDHHEPTAFGTWCPKVKPITTRGIASILKKYGIRPKQDSAGSCTSRKPSRMHGIVTFRVATLQMPQVPQTPIRQTKTIV